MVVSCSGGLVVGVGTDVVAVRVAFEIDVRVTAEFEFPVGVLLEFKLLDVGGDTVGVGLVGE